MVNKFFKDPSISTSRINPEGFIPTNPKAPNINSMAAATDNNDYSDVPTYDRTNWPTKSSSTKVKKTNDIVRNKLKIQNVIPLDQQRKDIPEDKATSTDKAGGASSGGWTTATEVAETREYYEDPIIVQSSDKLLTFQYSRIKTVTFETANGQTVKMNYTDNP